MKIEDLIKHELNNVLEIKCGKLLYNQLLHYPSVTVVNEIYTYYKAIPMSINTNECRLVMENFYDSIIVSLKDDAKKLNNKLTIAINNHDMQLYISTIKSLRDTLDLISKYDWRLMYSEYKIIDEDEIKNLEHQLKLAQDKIDTDKEQNADFISIYERDRLIRKIKELKNRTQIAIWEQNHDNQIRNHKIGELVKQ